MEKVSAKSLNMQRQRHTVILLGLPDVQSCAISARWP